MKVWIGIPKDCDNASAVCRFGVRTYSAAITVSGIALASGHDLPSSFSLAGAIAGEAIPLGPWLDALNSRIRKHIGKDARNLQIGHAYLMDDNGKPVTDFAKFSRIIAEDIIPLLEEYCYEDYDALTEILGGAIMDADRQRVREELFLPARRQDLIQALMVPTPELATTIEAVAQSTAALELDEEPEEPIQ